MTDQLSVRFEKQFPSGTKVRCDLELPASGFSLAVLFGPSGSGKSTILRVLAGLERPERGFIHFRGETWFDSSSGIHLSPQQRKIGIVFQDYALFPHLTVEQNIAFGLSKLARGERLRRVAEMISRLRLQGLERRLPTKLSGGEQQRVALARTLVCRPRLLLLDEPLSALDQPTREELRRELRALLQSFDLPVVLVTHDRVETIALAEQVVVLLGGEVQQVGTVHEVFNHPANGAVAQIVGVETVLPGRITGMSDGVASVEVGSVTLRAAAHEHLPEHVTVCIRGEEVLLERVAEGATSARNRFRAKVLSIVSEGPVCKVLVDGGFELTALITRNAREEMQLVEGETVIVVLKAHGVHLVPRE